VVAELTKYLSVTDSFNLWNLRTSGYSIMNEQLWRSGRLNRYANNTCDLAANALSDPTNPCDRIPPRPTQGPSIRRSGRTP